MKKFFVLSLLFLVGCSGSLRDDLISARGEVALVREALVESNRPVEAAALAEIEDLGAVLEAVALKIDSQDETISKIGATMAAVGDFLPGPIGGTLTGLGGLLMGLGHGRGKIKSFNKATKLANGSSGNSNAS